MPEKKLFFKDLKPGDEFIFAQSANDGEYGSTVYTKLEEPVYFSSAIDVIDLPSGNEKKRLAEYLHGFMSQLAVVIKKSGSLMGCSDDVEVIKLS